MKQILSYSLQVFEIKSLEHFFLIIYNIKKNEIRNLYSILMFTALKYKLDSLETKNKNFFYYRMISRFLINQF